MKIIIENEAYLKLKTFVSLVDTEISGMAKSKIDKEENIIVTDFIIFNQEVTASSTIISDESQAKFLNEMMKKGEDPSSYNIWWHSHCDMGVFWSGTDDKTIEEHTSQSYLISIVVNKKMEIKARLDIYPKDTSPFKQPTSCTFDIDQIEYLTSKEELKLKEKKEEEIKKLTEAYEKQFNLIEKKYENKNEEKIKSFCQKEIDSKVKAKVYLPVTYNYGRRVYDYSKGYKPRKKWNWFQGIILDNLDTLDDYEDYNDEYFNNGKQIGFQI